MSDFTLKVCLDFDGVVHSYDSGWQGDATIIADEPVPGAFEFIEECLAKEWDVVVFSTRSHEPGAVEAMRQWMIDHGLSEELASRLGFPTTKPNAQLFIDDRGHLFEGTFPSTEYIETFKPWNKRGPR